MPGDFSPGCVEPEPQTIRGTNPGARGRGVGLGSAADAANPRFEEPGDMWNNR